MFCQEDRNNATHKSQANISVNNSRTGTIRPIDTLCCTVDIIIALKLCTLNKGLKNDSGLWSKGTLVIWK